MQQRCLKRFLSARNVATCFKMLLEYLKLCHEWFKTFSRCLKLFLTDGNFSDAKRFLAVVVLNVPSTRNIDLRYYRGIISPLDCISCFPQLPLFPHHSPISLLLLLSSPLLLSLPSTLYLLSPLFSITSSPLHQIIYAVPLFLTHGTTNFPSPSRWRVKRRIGSLPRRHDIFTEGAFKHPSGDALNGVFDHSSGCVLRGAFNPFTDISEGAFDYSIFSIKRSIRPIRV